MAIVRAPPEKPRPLTNEDLWRREYLADQERRRIIGYQPDLSTAKPVTRYHRHRQAPSWDRTPDETLEDKLERIAGDPLATFGPLRGDRPAHLTPTEKAEIVAKAANWLRVSQRVRLVDAPGAVDPAFGVQRYLGRYGVVWRLCGSPFNDHCYVFFDPIGGERTAKIELAELRDLEPER
ncbi:hypothetical protein [Sphingomonas sp. PAMC 26605]|uniref:hypothetical protein n=1 Tax=Sphingomonas sp. PAMC 26605 TaxID=1112214 RepID=UPI0012F47D62|nr:hypothetical protein [Sphingomonas sp. PAMC 26605]